MRKLVVAMVGAGFLVGGLSVWVAMDASAQASGKTNKYAVIGFNNYEEFDTAVEDAIAEGWNLQGGVAVTCGQYRCTYYQAVSYTE
ncbi:MAG: hypothetical protein AAGK23_09305 [Pseudomonadota bacterium]